MATDSYDDILEFFDLANVNINHVEESLQVKLAKYISNPYISSLLLTIGFVGLVIEILTPGFGIGGTISIIGLVYTGEIFRGNFIDIFNPICYRINTIGYWAMIPGFGLPGISGIILVLIGTVLAMGSLKTAVVSLSIAILITTIVTIVLIKMGYRSKLLNKIVLDTAHEGERGYLSVDSPIDYLNKEGKSITELRPAGFIEIDGEKLDALSDGGFIPKEMPIKVVRVEGSKIFVRRL